MKPHQIATLKNYVDYCIKTKEVKPSTFHSEYKPYHRKQTTLNLIQKAFKTQVLIEPRIYCIPDLEVNLHNYERIPLVDLYNEKKKDDKVTYMIALTGLYALLIFSKSSKRELTYMGCISPSIPAQKTFETLDFSMYPPKEIPPMKSPEWNPLDWKIYDERRDPTISSVKIGKKLGISYKIVLRRYKKLLEDCKIWLPFFPNGYSHYTPYNVILKTEYETAIISELRKLDRSSYIYKFSDTLMLTLFFDQYLQINNLLKMEKEGIIHEVRVSSPVWHFDRFW